MTCKINADGCANRILILASLISLCYLTGVDGSVACEDGPGNECCTALQLQQDPGPHCDNIQKKTLVRFYLCDIIALCLFTRVV